MRSTMIDIVITDLTMQPIDGIDFVRLLRNSPDSPDPMAPVIMVTGHSTRRRVNECRDAGVNEVLAKPIPAQGVLSRIAEVIENPRACVRTEDYCGSDRHRYPETGHTGKMRRSTDSTVPPEDTAETQAHPQPFSVRGPMRRLARSFGLIAVLLLCQGCIATVIGAAAGTAVGVTGAVIVGAAKSVGAVGRAVIPGDSHKDR